MLLQLESDHRLILRDDHGDVWHVTLDPAHDEPDQGAPRTIRFQAPGEDPLEALYEGQAANLAELTLDDVVDHFLLAKE